MKEKFEASPYIHTIGNETAKNELYKKIFDVSMLGNLKGARPIKGFGFWESDESYSERLKNWEKWNKEVIFDGWVCKDMQHFHIFSCQDESVTIKFESNEYSINIGRKVFNFGAHPYFIDDFINDCCRVGIKLFWNDEIIIKYTPEAITSTYKTIEVYKLFKNIP